MQTLNHFEMVDVFSSVAQWCIRAKQNKKTTELYKLSD